MTRKARIVSTGLALAVLAAFGLGFAALQVYEIRWRAQVLAHKLRGDIDDLSLSETIRWLRPGSAVYLEGVAQNPNPFVSISNTFTTPGDRQAGQGVFDAKCARCHGDDAAGGAGPALADPARGTSDWAMFRAIQRGVPNTAMQAQPLDETQIWQVIAYVRGVTAGRTIETAGSSQPARIVRAGDPDLKISGDEWSTFAGSMFGWRYSKLDQLDRENVHGLSLAWMHQIDSDERMVETTPLVVDGVMFATEPPGTVVALDAVTGEVLWRYRHPVGGTALCCGAVNRGLAIRDDLLYVGTVDAHLVAIDAATGRVKWDVQVAPAGKGYSITSAPLVVDQLVITGIAGGEFGISGFLAAFDRLTGKEAWRFNTIPGDGDELRKTWAGGRATGGVPTWGTGTYDPDLGLVYWGAGHPAPDFNGDGRTGDNLYSNSLLAIDPRTGKLAWYFQFTPHDEWDWDSTQMPVLVDREIDGRMRKLVLFANRNGFYYVLDRTNGQFINGVPFVRQTWADGLSATGRALVRDAARPSREGTLVYPGVTGGTNWWPPSYSPVTDVFYVPFIEKPNIFFKWEETYEPGAIYLGGIARPVPGYRHRTGVRALDPLTGKRLWQIRFPERSGWSYVGGVLTTAANLLFVGDDQTFYAADAATGAILWSVRTGGGINAAPMTYLADSRQHVTIAAGRTLLTFALPRASAR